MTAFVADPYQVLDCPKCTDGPLSPKVLIYTAREQMELVFNCNACNAEAAFLVAFDNDKRDFIQKIMEPNSKVDVQVIDGDKDVVYSMLKEMLKR